MTDTPQSKSSTFARYLPVSDRDRCWGIYITTIGESRIRAACPVYPPMRHPEGYQFGWEKGRVLKNYALVYISRGGGQFESASCPPITVQGGDAFLLFPGVWHRYRPAIETGWDEHWIGFDGPVAKSLLQPNFFPPERPVIKLTQELVCLHLFTEAVTAIKTNQPALQQLLGGITTHLLGLLYSAQQTKQVGGDQSLVIVQKALQQMRAQITTTIDMPSLAQQLHVSYSTFRHTFAEHTGMSPLQYLLELRMAQARNLLQETTLSVREVAEQTGFEDEHYFSRLFRKRVGEAPSQWRAHSQAKINRHVGQPAAE